MHEALWFAVQKEFPDVKLVATRGDCWLSKCKVLTLAGDIVHDDHKAFLRREIAADGGNAAATWKRLRERNLFLSRCDVENLYLVHHLDGVTQEDFIQLDIRVETERIHRELLQEPSWQQVTELQDLLYGFGDELPRAAQTTIRPTSYALGDIVSMATFVREAGVCHMELLASTRNKIINVTDLIPGKESVTRKLTHGEFAPAAYNLPWSGQRMFDDWRDSSAGRGGHLISDHWVFNTSDHTERDGIRHMQFVPMWAGPALTAVEQMLDRPDTFSELREYLEDIDHQMECPFAWYFFALHGNRLGGWAMEMVIEAVEAGRHELAEHDYRVLKRWQAANYSF